MKVLLSMILLMPTVALAQDLKAEFLKAVVSECKLSEAEAEKLATPGRSGNVLKWKMCPQNPVEVDANCKVACSNVGKVIGQ